MQITVSALETRVRRCEVTQQLRIRSRGSRVATARCGHRADVLVDSPVGLCRLAGTMRHTP